MTIFHLMLWTFFSAIFLALSRMVWTVQIEATQSEMPPESVSIRQASDVLHSLAVGAVLTGAITLAYARKRFGSGWAILRHPGHWLLLAQAVFLAAMLPMSTILTVLVFWSRSSGSSGLVLYGLTYLPPTVIYLIAGVRVDARRWKWLFVALVAAGTFECLFYLVIFPAYSRSIIMDYLVWVQSTLRLLIPIWILILSILDLVARQRRDWLHWLGVASYVLLAGVPALLTMWQRFF